jgi:hypothetical protein
MADSPTIQRYSSRHSLLKDFLPISLQGVRKQDRVRRVVQLVTAGGGGRGPGAGDRPAGL